MLKFLQLTGSNKILLSNQKIWKTAATNLQMFNQTYYLEKLRLQYK